MLLGYLAVQRDYLPESAIPGLNGFVLFFALPCMLFRFGASMPFAQLIDPVLIAIWGGSALLMVGFTIALTLRRSPDGARRVDEGRRLRRAGGGLPELRLHGLPAARSACSARRSPGR